MLTGFAFVVGLLMMAPSPADSLPRGFRYPTEADRRGAWEAFKGEVPTPFHAKADFNGDGISDDAWILLHESNEGWGLFVFVNEPVGSPSVIELEREMGSTAAQQLGVAVVSPGEYETACGKGYWDCEVNEPEKLELALPALDFFTFESANSFFWWDASSRRFARTWMSD